MISIVTTVITSIATGFIGYGFFVLQENRKMKMRLLEKDQEKKEALKKQREEILEEVDRAQNEELQALAQLEVANIKQDIYDMHQKYTKKGYMPGFLKETLEAKFKYYHSHGGNGHGEHMYNVLMELPEKDPNGSF